MAQHCGFFESRWDETLINPETGTLGDWDLKYFYNQFSEYFSKFFGNGVYYNPDDCLKAIANGGMSVLVKAGWGFIKGFWYELDEDTTLTVPANSTAYDRTDSIMLRWNLTNRTISLVYLTDTVTPTRNDVTYDLKLAEIIVGAGVAEVLGSVITDTRTNQEVCGIVRGLEADAIDTETLFAQYDAIFNEWFDTIKDQLVGDLGARLQLEFDELNQNVEDYYENTTEAIATYQQNTATQIGNYEQQIAQQISGYNTNYQATLNAERQIVADFVDKDYVIPAADAQTPYITITFDSSTKKWRYTDAKITANTLVDVYFTNDTYDAAFNASVFVDSYSGYFELTCENLPLVDLKAIFRVRVR